MKILAIETSTLTGGVALLEDQRLLAEGRLSVKAIHSERLMPMIDFLLKSVKLSINDIDYLAAAVGPGSFTGLRVGLSTVKGLAFGLNKKVIPVSTLEAYASSLSFLKDHLICPMLDARRQEVYTALYKHDLDGLQTLIEPVAVKVEEFINSINSETVFVGDGAMLYQDIIRDALGQRAIFAEGSLSYPSPVEVGFIAFRNLQKGIVVDAKELSPVYLRKSEAEIKSGL